MNRRVAIWSGVIIAVLAVGWFAASKYWIYVPGILGEWRDPIGPAQEVKWDEGPETASVPAGKRPPNIVVILADDLGYNDITFNGGGVAGGAVPTPNIDSIGHDGVDFTNGYAGNATCAPSRAAIMTGRYATRFGFEFTPAPVAFERLVGTFSTDKQIRKPIFHEDRVAEWPDDPNKLGVPAEETTIAELLKTQGYRTLLLGKWHLGGTPTSRPQAQGFDEFLGFLPGASMYLDPSDPRVVNSRQDFDPIDRFLWANLPFAVRKDTGSRFEPKEYMTDYLADEAVDAIHANRNRPFFMYLSFNAPHTPLQALKSDYDALPEIENHRLRVYAAMIRALDRGVGKVLDALKKEGLDENTLVIFTSDNGGAHYIGLDDINKPYRGWKATFFQGGIRVPFFMRWPARISAGARYDEPVAHVDIFGTAAAAAGVAEPQDRVMDGRNLLQYVDGKEAGDPHKSLFWRSGDYMVLLSGDWKLQVSEKPKKDWLFNLKDDPTEQTNLADSQPEKLAEMKAKLADVNGQQAKPLWPSLLEGPIPIDHPLGEADSPNDEYIYWSN